MEGERETVLVTEWKKRVSNTVRKENQNTNRIEFINTITN